MSKRRHAVWKIIIVTQPIGSGRFCPVAQLVRGEYIIECYSGTIACKKAIRLASEDGIERPYIAGTERLSPLPPIPERYFDG